MRIGYACVSTDDQTLDLQRDALKRAKCRQIYEEHASGKTTIRPELFSQPECPTTTSSSRSSRSRTVQWTEQQNASVSLTDLFQAYLEIKPHLSDVWREQMQTVQNRFRKFGDTIIASITSQDIESIIELKENPIHQMDIPYIEKKFIRIFSNKLIEGMLRVSLNSYPELLPYLILGSFCRLRSNSPELLHLTW
jgi:hypothetical protein